MRTTPIDETHSQTLRSWVDSANDPASDFPIQNLPFGVFSRTAREATRIGAAIGDSILDLRNCATEGLLTGMPTGVLKSCDAENLNALMARPEVERRALRHRVSHLLRAGDAQVTARLHAARVIVPQRDVSMSLPARIGDYTDFYASIDHATNIGSMLRPDNPLLPNYKWIPVGYHGRSSSIVVSGTNVRHPRGQSEPPIATEAPQFGPSKALDYELEMGIFVAEGNELGAPVSIFDAPSRIFGLCLLNDWSARDIQKWEYVPLGPFLAKNFATSISPWVVTAEALAPYRVASSPRADADPAPLPHLRSADDEVRGAFDIQLEVFLSTASMRASGAPPQRLSTSNLASLYWTPAQMIAHHTSGGCNLLPGDLLGTGTVSGKEKSSRGCLMELTMRGKERVALPNGETRGFLEDGDEVVFKASCARDGFARIGFGECRGLSLPSRLQLAVLAACLISQDVVRAANERPRARDLGITPGVLKTGPLNAITDVEGVKVGHATLIEGDRIRTGVTAIVPHDGNLFQQKVPGAVFVGNAFGKLAGSTQVQELGSIETPIVLTNTTAVGAAVDAVIGWTLAQAGNESVRSVNALVGETNDGGLNDIRSQPVRKEHVLAAIRDAKSGMVAEGAVGAGTGTVAFGLKGGIGTASRIVTIDGRTYTVGSLVQSNFGGVLSIDGVPVGKEMGQTAVASNSGPGSGMTNGDGSCMIVIATDAPLSARDLTRLAARGVFALARTGSSYSNGSGDFAIAFSTAKDLRIAFGARFIAPKEMLLPEAMSPLFEAALEATEEAVYNSMLKAETTTGNGRTVQAIDIEKLKAILKKYGR